MGGQQTKFFSLSAQIEHGEVATYSFFSIIISRAETPRRVGVTSTSSYIPRVTIVRQERIVMARVKDNDKREFMVRELEMIQNLINRMGTNSFAVKGWTITLVAGILLFKGSTQQVSIALIPVFAFWYLDAYFLWQERRYRKAYEWVLKNRLSSDEHLFDMNASRFEASISARIGTMFSATLIILYGTIAIAIILYYLSMPNG